MLKIKYTIHIKYNKKPWKISLQSFLNILLIINHFIAEMSLYTHKVVHSILALLQVARL